MVTNTVKSFQRTHELKSSEVFPAQKKRGLFTVHHICVPDQVMYVMLVSETRALTNSVTLKKKQFDNHRGLVNVRYMYIQINVCSQDFCKRQERVISHIYFYM